LGFVLVQVFICMTAIIFSDRFERLEKITIAKQQVTNFFIRKEYIEVPVPEVIPPKDPEIEIMTQYIKSRNGRLSVEVAAIISECILENSKIHNIPTQLIIGIMEKESIFNPSIYVEIPAKKGDYAKGLMMIYQAEEIEVDKDQAYDLKYNINLGCIIFNKKLSLNNGNVEKALANYSGNANDYESNVLSNVGRYSLYKWKVDSRTENQKLAFK